MQKSTREVIEFLSGGLFRETIDLILFAASVGVNLYKTAFALRQKLLFSSYYARKKGWLAKGRESLQLTVRGKHRLARVLPYYRKERPWRNRFFLITYDIKERRRVQRDQLRKWLWQNGCRMIQESVWISVYDLTEAIAVSGLIDDKNDLVLVSWLEKGMGVGREKIKDLVARIYQKELESVNRKYYQFINSVNKKIKLTVEEIFSLKMRFLAILKDDPQLPFKLLPADWQGEKAYKLYMKL